MLRKKQTVLLQKVLTSVVVEGNEAIIFEVNAETDFVAKNEGFQTLVKELAEHLLKNKPATVEEATRIKQWKMAELLKHISTLHC